MAKSLKQIREAKGTATPMGSNAHNKRVRHFDKTSLGGKRLQSRARVQSSSGNQSRTQNTFESIIEQVKKKMKEDSKNNPGKTDTGKKAEPVDTEPNQKLMTGYHE